MQIIGIAGAVVLAAAWIPEIIEIIRIRESKLNPNFAKIALLGTTLLLAYSIIKADFVFIAVNGFIFAQLCIALYYEYVVEPKSKKRNKKS
ncbi:MAG: lipid-A-disaccharide synthase N-terminal domain-containing protein [Candidatus Nanoarchaeia archaeon]|nr:lipid-A-disaccharide synthase N-terminal domain-containing protein [Candidatus Nanoarchaeia archaeon]